jgi:hypothetical protein
MGTSITTRPHIRDLFPRRRPAPEPTTTTGADPRQLEAAYQRGRRDESLRRRRSPFFGFIGFLSFVVVALFCYEAANTGSFANAGAYIDQHVSSVTTNVQAPIKNAETNAGSALSNAGQKLSHAGGAGK